jgi:2-polyprenyl-6-methoxyphenol hydroxylase-like FAD-dependent oxidoreductase
MNRTGDRFDVVVVGGRCAGAPLATLLARIGLRVCVLERAAFPSDTPSTHGIQPSGVRLLDRLGVGEEVRRVGANVVGGVMRVDDIAIELSDVLELCGAPMVNVRRVTLDPILLDAAAEVGAEVRTQTPVTGILRDGDRVVGVETRDGPVHASLVVGADGARSTVARLVGAREYARTEAERAFLWGYFEGAQAPPDRIWLGNMGDVGFLASHTDGGLFMAAIAPPLDRWGELRGDRDAAHADGIRRWPELHAALEGARRVGPLQAMTNWHGFFRESAGPGWALVGDAGHFKDPSPGQGIADALRQVFALAPAIEEAVATGSEQPLHAWWRWRDRDAWEMYWFAHDLGSAEPDPVLVLEVQRRLAADRELARGLVRVLDHDLPPSAVFTPRLVAQTTARALRSGVAPRRALLREVATIGARDVRRQLQGRRSPAARARGARASWRSPARAGSVGGPPSAPGRSAR